MSRQFLCDHDSATRHIPRIVRSEGGRKSPFVQVCCRPENHHLCNDVASCACVVGDDVYGRRSSSRATFACAVDPVVLLSSPRIFHGPMQNPLGQWGERRLLCLVSWAPLFCLITQVWDKTIPCRAVSLELVQRTENEGEGIFRGNLRYKFS